MHFTSEQDFILVTFLRHVDMIIDVVAKAKDKEQFPATSTVLLLDIYSYWTKYDLLPEDGPAGN